MNIFISWSGELSKQIGEVLRDWMPMVIQSIKPYFTPTDIEKGTRWDNEISGKLNECVLGLLVLTKDNLTSPWIMFEAGALSNKLEKSRVCPILFEVDNADIIGPLASFQTTPFKKSEIKKLMSNFNSLLETPLSDELLRKSFDSFWPELDDKIKAIITEIIPEVSKVPKRTDRDLLEEILELTRYETSKSRIDRPFTGSLGHGSLVYGLGNDLNLTGTEVSFLRSVSDDYFPHVDIEPSNISEQDQLEIFSHLVRNSPQIEPEKIKEFIRRYYPIRISLSVSPSKVVNKPLKLNLGKSPK